MVGPAIAQKLPVYEWANVSAGQFIGGGFGYAAHVGINMYMKRPMYASKCRLD